MGKGNEEQNQLEGKIRQFTGKTRPGNLNIKMKKKALKVSNVYFSSVLVKI